ncbi:MAG: ATP-binding cassette domain-containing protein [Synergistaceae bacterium]|nr:ATP-binding cassette domain-containing protein [Synergistaceae bacterium]
MGTPFDPVILLKAADFAYDGDKRVLKGISLEVARGERLVILGHNGSGKSTLVKILGALQNPSQGACFICGCDVSKASFAEIHRKVSVVFQNPETQIVGAVVEDDVAFAPENQGLPSAEIQRRVSWALEKVGLLHKRSALSSTLSGGEKQRLALAGALAADFECLVLDEPTAMLDPEGRLEVEKVLRDIHVSGKTIIQVTHRLEDLRDAERVLVLSHGEWAWEGRREEFGEVAESLGFELPPLSVLESRLASRGVTFSPPAAEPAAEAIAAAFSGSFAASEKTEETPRARESEPPFFEVRGLSCSFNPSTPLEMKVLEDVSCLAPSGGWLSVLGRTGSGKSTLIQHLNGICKIQSGEILIEGLALPQSGEELRNLRRRVGLVFQMPETQLFSSTVREELSFAPRNWGFSESETGSLVEEALAGVGLSESYLERNPLLLSGGERRLVAIASVLSARPECIVLDEPTAGLDEVFRKKILSLLDGLRKSGVTVVTVTHDFDMALEYSDRLLLLSDGLRLYEGGVRGILPVLSEMEKCMAPEILQLSGLLRRRGLNVPLTWKADELWQVLSPGL